MSLMLSRSLADPSAAVLRAALHLLRRLLQSTLALSAAPELARFTHRSTTLTYPYPYP